MDASRFDHWLETLLWEHTLPGISAVAPMQIMRMKGVVAPAGSAQRVVVQGVHELFDQTATTAWEIGEPRVNRLVFIGTHDKCRKRKPHPKRDGHRWDRLKSRDGKKERERSKQRERDA